MHLKKIISQKTCFIHFKHISSKSSKPLLVIVKLLQREGVLIICYWYDEPFFQGTYKSAIYYFSGFLYGRYEQFPDVPLGIKAVVSAIYEPPQEGTRDGVKLEPAQPETEAELAALASNLGLQRVGWMFTDLIPSSDGQVKHFRNIDTYFLSSQVYILHTPFS